MSKKREEEIPVVDYNKYLSEEALTTTEAVVDAVAVIPEITDKMVDLDDDSVLWEISRLINLVSAQVNSYLGRELALKEYKEIKNNASTSELQVNNFPVKDILKIELYNGSGFTSLDANSIEVLTDMSDLRRGALYLETIFPSRRNRVGLSRYPQQYLKSIKITYEAGYVLPKDDSEETPSDLPMDIEGIVVEACRRIFNKSMDGSRTDGLTSLQEGNIKREWASEVSSKQSQYGALEVPEQQILMKYRVTKSIYSV